MNNLRQREKVILWLLAHPHYWSERGTPWEAECKSELRDAGFFTPGAEIDLESYLADPRCQETIARRSGRKLP